MGLIHTSTLNSSRDENGIIWTASFQKSGHKGNTYKVHIAKKFSRVTFGGKRAIVRTVRKKQLPTKHLCDWELIKVAKAREIVKAFNKLIAQKYKIKIKVHNVVKALVDSDHDEWCLIENRCPKPFIQFVDKYGKSKPEVAEFQILQTLMHFSYHYTSGKMIITGLKGCRYSNSFTLSTPTIHSVSGCFGLKDEGVAGIEFFFQSHRCNADCNIFIQYDPETEIKFRLRTPSAPYEPEELDIHVEKSEKDSEWMQNGFENPERADKPPPYSPVDPNPPPDKHNIVIDNTRFVFSFEDKRSLSVVDKNHFNFEVDSFNCSDDVIR